jgi:hypothetical protein
VVGRLPHRMNGLHEVDLLFAARNSIDTELAIDRAEQSIIDGFHPGTVFTVSCKSEVR